MKKIFCIVMCLLLILSSGCAPKSEISANTFITKLTEKNFMIEEVSDSIISADNGKYSITFRYPPNSEEVELLPYAIDQTFESAERNYNTRFMSVEKHGNDYDCMYFNSGDKFCIISRIGNTIMTCETDKEYRNEILSIFDELGYK